LRFDSAFNRHSAFRQRGQQPHLPHQQAGHVTAPDQCCRNVRKSLPGRRPHVTPGCVKTARLKFFPPYDSWAIRGGTDETLRWLSQHRGFQTRPSGSAVTGRRAQLGRWEEPYEEQNGFRIEDVREAPAQEQRALSKLTTDQHRNSRVIKYLTCNAAEQFD
jgi:hypothetical protein